MAGGLKQTLQEVHAVTLDTWPRQHVAILTTTYGEPFTSKGCANWCADRIADAGLPDRCVTHGLRKAAARRLAEAGCTALQIASITGHKEVERYTRAANQKGSPATPSASSEHA